MKAVMYHYVRPNASEPPYYYYLDTDDFGRQLDYFEQEYGFVDRSHFLAACRGEDVPSSEGVVLTFDDGLLADSNEVGLMSVDYSIIPPSST